MALFGDKVYVAAGEAVLVALDAKTGREVWTAPVGDNKAGYYISLAPLVAGGKVMVLSLIHISVHFGHFELASRAGRPFDETRVAAKLSRVAIALKGPSRDDFPARLRQITQF